MTRPKTRNSLNITWRPPTVAPSVPSVSQEVGQFGQIAAELHESSGIFRISPNPREGRANLVFSQIFAEEIVPEAYLNGDGSDIPPNAADRSLLKISNWFCEVSGSSSVLDVSRALPDQTS